MGNASSQELVRVERRIGLRYYVYIVKTSKGHLYTGISTNPHRRTEEHNNGSGAKCLLGQRPVKLVWKSDAKMSRSEASKLEAKIKKLSHDDKVFFINGDLNI